MATVMYRVIVKNIGELFTGDIARPVAAVRTVRIEDDRIAALSPDEPAAAEEADADIVIDAAGGGLDANAHFARGRSQRVRDVAQSVPLEYRRDRVNMCGLHLQDHAQLFAEQRSRRAIGAGR